MHPQRLNAAEAARYLHVDVSALQYWRSQGVGPSWYKIGRRVMYDIAQLDQFVEHSKGASHAHSSVTM